MWKCKKEEFRNGERKRTRAKNKSSQTKSKKVKEKVFGMAEKKRKGKGHSFRENWSFGITRKILRRIGKILRSFHNFAK